MLRVDELRCGACSTHADRDNDWTHRRSRSRTCTYGSEQDERSGPRRAEAFRRTTVPRAEDRRGRRDREPARSSSRRKNHWRLTRWARSMSPACSSVRSRVEVASAAGLRYTERSCVRRSHQPSLTLQLHVSFGWQAHCGSGGTADALASGASWSNPVGVQIPASAPASALHATNQTFGQAGYVTSLAVAKLRRRIYQQVIRFAAEERSS